MRATNDPFPVINLLDVSIHQVTEDECGRYVIQQLERGIGGWVLTINLTYLRQYQIDPKFASYCQTASLIVADGMPVVWASHLTGKPLPERVTGSNLIWSLTEKAAKAGRSIFLLGASPHDSQEAARKLIETFPQAILVGVYSPPMDFEQNSDEVDEAIKRIEAARPDIIYVALGLPKQEWFISHLRTRLPDSWLIGVGASFSFIAGTISRAPILFQRLGMEWLFRLMQEPRRLSRRYLLYGIPFGIRLLLMALGQRFQRNKHSK